MNSRRAQKAGPEVAGSCFRFPAEVNVLECHAQMQEALGCPYTHKVLSICTAGVAFFNRGSAAL